MNILSILLGAFGGAGLMYLLDPQWGKRRRAMLRDQMVKYWNRAGNTVDGLSAESRNRAQGIIAEARHRLSNEPVANEILVARVRSEMGRFVSHPKVIEVIANDGQVVLSGSILANELQPLLGAIKSLQGVHNVENRLRVYEYASDLPELRGGRARSQMP
jgi:hypothetical protein